MTDWKRKGPKGCYETIIDGRKAFLERMASRPTEIVLWSLHVPETGGYLIHTLAARNNAEAFVLADRVLTEAKVVTAPEPDA